MIIGKAADTCTDLVILKCHVIKIFGDKDGHMITTIIIKLLFFPPNISII